MRGKKVTGIRGEVLRKFGQFDSPGVVFFIKRRACLEGEMIASVWTKNLTNHCLLSTGQQ